MNRDDCGMFLIFLDSVVLSILVLEWRKSCSVFHGFWSWDEGTDAERVPVTKRAGLGVYIYSVNVIALSMSTRRT